MPETGTAMTLSTSSERELNIMSDEITPEPQTLAQMQANLKHLASALRNAEHLAPETQTSLASLLEELGTELNSHTLPTVHAARLTDAVNEVARSVHEQHSEDLAGTARNNLKDAAVSAETDAPVATGLVYRLIDVLASIGI
jgi:hypothetical protein